MNLTQEQIVKLIADAFRVGRAEGLEVGQKDGYADGLLDGDAEGYERGWSDGWDEGYAKAEEDAADNAEEDDDLEVEVVLEDDEDEDEDHNPATYALGWNDGYVGDDMDSEFEEDESYIAGYVAGTEDRENEPDAA